MFDIAPMLVPPSFIVTSPPSASRIISPATSIVMSPDTLAMSPDTPPNVTAPSNVPPSALLTVSAALKTSKTVICIESPVAQYLAQRLCLW